jgi:hypothetical protein
MEIRAASYALGSIRSQKEILVKLPITQSLLASAGVLALSAQNPSIPTPAAGAAPPHELR